MNTVDILIIHQKDNWTATGYSDGAVFLRSNFKRLRNRGYVINERGGWPPHTRLTIPEYAKAMVNDIFDNELKGIK